MKIRSSLGTFHRICVLFPRVLGVVLVHGAVVKLGVRVQQGVGIVELQWRGPSCTPIQ